MNKAGTRLIVFIFIILFGGAAMVAVAEKWPAAIFLWLVMVVGSLVWLIRWHAEAYVYQCSKCQSHFAVSAWTDALSPHMMETKLLRCPSCGHSDWFKGVEREKVHGEILSAGSPRPVIQAREGSLNVQIAVVLILFFALWAYTLWAYGRLPNQICVLKNGVKVIRDKSIIFTLPLIAAIFPLMQAVLLGFAARQGYKSRVYIGLTVLFAFIILLLSGFQYMMVSSAMN